MATIKKFEDLEIWQLARILTKSIHEQCLSEPFRRDFELVNQINRSSGSVMDNIAEGFGRGGNKEFRNFLSYSTGSAAEVKSQLYRAFDRDYITKEKFDELYELTDKVSNKTGAFMGYLTSTEKRGVKFGITR